jgi:hypothetical protein
MNKTTARPDLELFDIDQLTCRHDFYNPYDIDVKYIF